MSNLPSLLIQPNTCNTQNPIHSLNKTIHSNSRYDDRFQSTSSSSQQQHQSILPPTDQFIKLQINQEQAKLQQQQLQHFNQLPIENIPRNLNHIQPNHSQQDWSSTFLKSVPIQSLLSPKIISRSPINSNQWQSEFVNSLQLPEKQHQLPINKFNHPHSLIQHRPIIPSTNHHLNLPTQFNHPIQSHSQNSIYSQNNLTDWDSAFSKYGLNHDNNYNNLTEQNTSFEPTLQPDHNHQIVHEKYLIGSHSPTRSTSPDALAKTAASLIATVEKNGQLGTDRDMVTPLDPVHGSASEKLIQSSFIDLMRKLRDGELKVEGDKLVPQVPLQNSVTSPTTDHHQTDQSSNSHHLQRSSDGQVNRSFGMSTQVIDQPDHLTRSSLTEQTQNSSLSNNLDHHAPILTYRHELESRMKEMNELMEETDEELERAQCRNRMNGFQGDGGAISPSSVDLDEIFNAASQVDRPLENQNWTTTTEVPGASESWTEEFDTLPSQQQEEEEFFDVMGMFGRPILDHEIELERLKRAQRAPSAQELERERLQNDWDSMLDQPQTSDHVPGQTFNSLAPAQFLERIEVLGPQSGYQFQQTKLHFLEQSNRTKHHSTHQGLDESTISETLRFDHGSVLESVLQKEKEVIASPESATAWYELGVKQQENEREELAIQALKKATQLDPKLSDAILALAISYANENQKDLAFQMIENWIDVQVSQVENYREHFRHEAQYHLTQEHPGSNFQSVEENITDAKKLQMQHEKLAKKLIQLARLGGRVKGRASVDPDVQIALGVLFNSNNEFQKACDCFAAALAVRPLDPLLFNRLGATFANSGKPEEAIEYYKRAIELLPGYIRARYNLSISLINLGKYFESIKNLINSLIIQHGQDQDYLKNNLDLDLDLVNDQPDTSSTVLWQTLEINCSLLRNEFSSVQSELDECFKHKDLGRISRILVNFN